MDSHQTYVENTEFQQINNQIKNIVALTKMQCEQYVEFTTFHWNTKVVSVISEKFVAFFWFKILRDRGTWKREPETRLSYQSASNFSEWQRLFNTHVCPFHESTKSATAPLTHPPLFWYSHPDRFWRSEAHSCTSKFPERYKGGHSLIIHHVGTATAWKRKKERPKWISFHANDKVFILQILRGSSYCFY